MQTRVNFNGGEYAPEMSVRVDLEAYYKGVALMENWELSSIGGVKRRRGLRRLTEALHKDSKLLPFVYSYSENIDGRFLIEVAPSEIRVLSDRGEELARFTSGVTKDSEDSSLVLTFDYSGDFRGEKIGKLMLLTSEDNPPMLIERQEDGVWVMREWRFKHRPWRYDNEQREHSITIRNVGGYEVEFSDNETGVESDLTLKRADYLRASFWVEQAEVESKSAELTDDVMVVMNVQPGAKRLDKFAVSKGETIEYFVCTADWAVSNYVSSLDSPINYPNNFLEAENLEDFEDVTPVYSIKDVQQEGTITKGTKIAIKSGYWEYWTCIKDFPGIVGGYYNFTDYPEYFMRGLAVGGALPCKGEWEFLCSGVWYGSYEVKRNYETAELNADWEPRGISFSRIAEASNTIISNTEADEECYMRLFLTRSKKMSDDDITVGFPLDSCGNRLLVKGYKHDAELKATPISSGGIYWDCLDKVKVLWTGDRTIKDWSWQAFSPRYGYPLLSKVHNKRLVFASTLHQPQTLWFSRTDDLYNFMTGDIETAAMILTMDTPSQNPICWLHSRSRNLMVGTSEGEYIINAGQAISGLSSTNAQLENHGFVGSAGIPALGVIDKVIYIERGAGRVREYGYSLEADGYRSLDLSVLAPHILSEHGGVRNFGCIAKPDNVLLFVLNDGQLAHCVYNSAQQIKGWHRWVTDGLFKSVCGLPNGNNADRIFFIVHHEEKNPAGILLSEETWLEVVDEESDYTDHGVDYVSRLGTNNLNNTLERRPSKDNKPLFWLCIGSAFTIHEDNFNISCDKGNTWFYKPQELTIMPAGWNEFSVPCGWRYENTVEIRVKGNNGCNILAIAK